MSRYELTLEPQLLPPGHPQMRPGAMGYHAQVCDLVDDSHAHLGFVAPDDLLPAPFGTAAYDRLRSWLADAVLAELADPEEGNNRECLELLEDAFASPGPLVFRPSVSARDALTPTGRPREVPMDMDPWGAHPDLEATAAPARAEARARGLETELPQAPCQPSPPAPRL